MTIEPIQEAAEYIRQHISEIPKVAVILGSGLGEYADSFSESQVLPYAEIPYFPTSTVQGHKGRFVFGSDSQHAIVAMQGRFHFYEGYSMKQITFPIRVMKKLGVEILLISNAAGGMNPQFRRGDLMIIDDHINLLGDNPLIGPNLDEFGPRFPDMSEPYDSELIALAEDIALQNLIKLQKGVFVAVSGPNLETRAEYRFLRWIGADVGGMSTVPEAVVAVHSGLRVLGISVITDECFPDALEEADIAEIIKTANDAEPNLTTIMKKVIEQL